MGSTGGTIRVKKRKKSLKRKIPGPGVLTWILSLCGFLPFTALLPGCLSPGLAVETGLVPGIYEGTGRGYRGPVHVQVQVSSAGIEDIVITGHRESSFPGAAAMEELLESVLETGSTDLDALSGATYSSRGFLEAVEEALEKAAARVQ